MNQIKDHITSLELIFSSYQEFLLLIPQLPINNDTELETLLRGQEEQLRTLLEINAKNICDRVRKAHLKEWDGELVWNERLKSNALTLSKEKANKKEDLPIHNSELGVQISDCQIKGQEMESYKSIETEVDTIGDKNATSFYNDIILQPDPEDTAQNSLDKAAVKNLEEVNTPSSPHTPKTNWLKLDLDPPAPSVIECKNHPLIKSIVQAVKGDLSKFKTIKRSTIGEIDRVGNQILASKFQYFDWQRKTKRRRLINTDYQKYRDVLWDDIYDTMDFGDEVESQYIKLIGANDFYFPLAETSAFDKELFCYKYQGKKELTAEEYKIILDDLYQFIDNMDYVRNEMPYAKDSSKTTLSFFAQKMTIFMILHGDDYIYMKYGIDMATQDSQFKKMLESNPVLREADKKLMRFMSIRAYRFAIVHLANSVQVVKMKPYGGILVYEYLENLYKQAGVAGMIQFHQIKQDTLVNMMAAGLGDISSIPKSVNFIILESIKDTEDAKPRILSILLTTLRIPQERMDSSLSYHNNMISSVLSVLHSVCLNSYVSALNIRDPPQPLLLKVLNLLLEYCEIELPTILEGYEYLSKEILMDYLLFLKKVPFGIRYVSINGPRLLKLYNFQQNEIQLFERVLLLIKPTFTEDENTRERREMFEKMEASMTGSRGFNLLQI